MLSAPTSNLRRCSRPGRSSRPEPSPSAVHSRTAPLPQAAAAHLLGRELDADRAFALRQGLRRFRAIARQAEEVVVEDRSPVPDVERPPRRLSAHRGEDAVGRAGALDLRRDREALVRDRGARLDMADAGYRLKLVSRRAGSGGWTGRSARPAASSGKTLYRRASSEGGLKLLQLVRLSRIVRTR